jgi:hypothetical protein
MLRWCKNNHRRRRSLTCTGFAINPAQVQVKGLRLFVHNSDPIVKNTMVKIVAVAAIVLLTHGTLLAKGGGKRTIPAGAAERISASRSKDHVDLLASDRMMGRNTPSPELDSAADYIADRFRAYGLEPVNGSYFHQYNLRRDNLGDNNRLSVDGKKFELKKDFVPFEFSASGTVRGEVVFVGYGLSRPGQNFDEYAGLDVRGKIVLAIFGEPFKSRLDTSSFLLGTDAQPRGKMLTAMQHGAAGMLLIANPASYKLLQPFVYWPSLYRSGKKIPPAFRVDLPKAGEQPIPVMNIGGDVAQALLGGASIEYLADRIRSIDSTLHPASQLLPGKMEFQVDINREYLPVRNVIGMVRGSRLPDEYVIIGAHYDHVGHSSPGVSAPKNEGDSIYNGADDNASGTAGLLLNAEAFGGLAPDKRPARSIIFIAFSGEEKGLYGSRAYVANPSVPNSQVVAMLNMDMIGRNYPDSVSVAGRSRSPQLAAVMEEANAAEPMTVAYNLEEMFFRSDQASFAAEQIPVLFFSSGEHADYHQVSDSPDKIDNTKVARIARLCFRTAWMVGEMQDRPAYLDVPVRDPNAILLDQ